MSIRIILVSVCMAFVGCSSDQFVLPQQTPSPTAPPVSSGDVDFAALLLDMVDPANAPASLVSVEDKQFTFPTDQNAFAALFP